MSVQSFYSEARWGNRFGIKGPHYGANGHRGHDVKAAAGAAIPALRGGRVVLVSYSSILGTYVVIEHAAGDFDGYCHVTRPVAQGAVLSQGQTVAFVAGAGDRPGSAWTGPHLHLTNGPTQISVHTGTVRDPAPIIRSVLSIPEVPVSPTLTDIPTVKRLAAWMNQQGVIYDGKHLKTDVDQNGDRGPTYWYMVQWLGRGLGLYPEPLLIDGKPGARTYAVEAQLAATYAQPPAPTPEPPAPTPEPTPAPTDVEALLAQYSAKVTADVVEAIRGMSFGVK